MEYCAPRGIPHSHFLGGPLVWTPADREKALWWLRHDQETCRSCGTRPSDFEDDPHAFVAEHVHCRGCEIRAQAEDQFEKHRSEFRRGTSIVLARPVLEVPDAVDGHPYGG